MKKKTLELTRDSQGKELLLKEGKFQVMMEWEKPYMEACIDALQPAGDVLEIGFGCGYSASRIQSYAPKSHTIIECDPVIATHARQFAEKHSNVIIIENTWQAALSSLGVFDAIFFDDYPLESEAEMQAMQTEATTSHCILEQGKHTLSEMQALITPHLPLHYQDDNLREFFDLLCPNQLSDPKHLINFFKTLKHSKHITPQQEQLALEISLAKGLITQKDLDLPKQSPFSFRQQGNRLFEFLSLALEKHMRKGSRFSCFLEDPTSKYQEKKFFESVITNPFLDYKEEWIEVDVPEHCAYYKANTALVITITSLAEI